MPNEIVGIERTNVIGTEPPQRRAGAGRRRLTEGAAAGAGRLAANES